MTNMVIKLIHQRAREEWNRYRQRVTRLETRSIPPPTWGNARADERRPFIDKARGEWIAENVADPGPR